MSLRGQGYAMAALLVALAVLSIMMSVALPVWRHEAQRHKEDELVWRGQQYVRAIRLYSAKMGGTLPPSYDVLVQGHFLRKKYKDPITDDDFEPIGAGAAQPAGPTPSSGQRGGVSTGTQTTGTQTTGTQTAGRQTAGTQTPGPLAPTSASQTTSQPSSAFSGAGSVPGGLIGVRSKSKAESIRLYQGRNHYNEWSFVYVSQQPGGPGGRGIPGGPGVGRPGQPGNRGGFPGGGFPGGGGPDGEGQPGRRGFPRGGPFGPGPQPTPFPFPPQPGRRGGGGL